MVKDTPIGAPLRPLTLISCPECAAVLREEKFRRHMMTVHSSEVPPGYEVRELGIIRCPECQVRLREDRLPKHMKNVHMNDNIVTQLQPNKILRPVISIQNIPIGLQVLADIGRHVHWKATQTETCATCRRRVVFLDVAKGTVKAFDVDREKRILGTHSCEERSESVYAYSAGIVDSNRRRH